MNDGPHGIDEGYVKYVSHWEPGPPPDADAVALLNRWRSPLFAAGLIGHYEEHGVGYGNLSVRHGSGDSFVISGTQTGHIAHTSAEHFALVTSVDIDANAVFCVGPIQASSEALTHAAIYALSSDIGAVVHVHDRELWARHMDKLPTTDAAVPYGTPAMAHAFELLWASSPFPRVGIAVMAGHDDGLVSIGRTLDEAATRMLTLASEGDRSTVGDRSDPG